MKIRFALLSTALLAGLLTSFPRTARSQEPPRVASNEDPYYRCLDAIEVAERFELRTHSGPGYNKSDLDRKTVFQGKDTTWSDIYDELLKIGYLNNESLGTNDKAKARAFAAKVAAKKAAALKIPRIAELARRWETEFRSKEAEARMNAENDALLTKTYTFHRTRGDSRLIEGTQTGIDHRDDQVSPNRPYGLVATRSRPDGQYLYLLTREGTRRIKVSDKPSTGEDRVYVVLRRNADIYKDDFDGKMVDQARKEVFSLKGETVTRNFPDRKHWDGLRKDFEGYVKKALGQDVALIDYKKTPSDAATKSDSDDVFHAELKKIMGEVVRSHQGQLDYFAHVDAEENASLKERMGLDGEGLSTSFTDRYVNALQTCASLPVGLADEAAAASAAIKANLQKTFPAKAPALAVVAPPAEPGSTTPSETRTPAVADIVR